MSSQTSSNCLFVLIYRAKLQLILQVFINEWLNLYDITRHVTTLLQLTIINVHSFVFLSKYLDYVYL